MKNDLWHMPCSPRAPMMRRVGERSDRGFSMIELLLVVALIAILSAIALPQVLRFIKNYQIRGGGAMVGGEIQSARGKAVSRNTNLGVLFLTVSTTQFRIVVEDDVAPPFSSVRRATSALLADSAQVGPVRELPTGTFLGPTTAPDGTTVTCKLPDGSTFTANDKGFRFDRLGRVCDPGTSTTTCPDLDAGATLVQNTTGGSYVCLTQPRTKLTRLIEVTPGGRASQ
jgi:prepilin-type N-terminal cleavage/methylation domain-containing protein